MQKLFTGGVLAILAVTTGTMVVVSSLESPLLLFMNEVGFTNAQHVSFYVRTVSIGLLVPVLSAIPLGHLASHFGAGITLSYAFLFVSLGFALICISRSSKLIFLAGYIMYSVCSGMRILRFSIIADLVSTEDRTLVMAVQQLMIPIGALISPCVWILIVRLWHSEIEVVQSILVIDRFTLSYAFGMFVAVSASFLCYTKLRKTSADTEITESSNPSNERLSGNSIEESNQSLNGYGSCNLPAPLKIVGIAELKHYRNTRLCFFAFLLLCIRLILAVFLALFQPVLIHRFGAGDEEVGRVYLLIGILSLIPPALVALASKLADDRQILLFGLVIELMGASMYLPFFSFLEKWQVIIGYLLVIKASAFFNTATISLFTKVLGPMGSAKNLGYVWSIANVLPAVVQISFASQIVGLFSTWKFSLFLVPIIIALSMTLCPAGWLLLDPSSDYARSCIAQAKRKSNCEENIDRTRV